MSVIKRTMSLIIAVMFAAALIVPAFAAENDITPVIVVSGMAVMPLSITDENGNESKAYPPETDEILKACGDIILPAAGLLLNGDWDAFADKAFPAVAGLLEPIACDNDGNSKYDITYPFYNLSMENYDFYLTQDKDEQAVVHAAVDAFGAKNVFFFNYDWRLDPLKHADDLNAFIVSVKEQTDSQKVVLAPCSMGGTVVLSYLEKYGSDDVSNCVFLSTAFQGTSVVGELFRRELCFDKDALILRINQLGREPSTKVLFPLITGALDKMGLFDLIFPVVDDLIENVGGKLYDEVICGSFGNMPGVWALVADKDYEAAKSSMLDGDVNQKLIDRIDYYHYNVAQKAETILSEAIDNGCFVSIVSQYNMQGLPVNVSYKSNNDFLIDTEYSSGGAICANLEETLGENYIQKNTSCGHNHVSADNVIDASACILPEQTWFIKNLAHIDFCYGTQAADFAVWLIGAKEQYNIFSNELYPQFISFDYDTGELTPVESSVISIESLSKTCAVSESEDFRGNEAAPENSVIASAAGQISLNKTIGRIAQEVQAID